MSDVLKFFFFPRTITREGQEDRRAEWCLVYGRVSIVRISCHFMFQQFIPAVMRWAWEIISNYMHSTVQRFQASSTPLFGSEAFKSQEKANKAKVRLIRIILQISIKDLLFFKKKIVHKAPPPYSRGMNYIMKEHGIFNINIEVDQGIKLF